MELGERPVLPEEKSAAMGNQVVAFRRVRNERHSGQRKSRLFRHAMLERSIRSPAVLAEWKLMRSPLYWRQRLQREGGSNQSGGGGGTSSGNAAILSASAMLGGGGGAASLKDTVAALEEKNKLLERKVESLEGQVQLLQGEIAGQKGVTKELSSQVKQLHNIIAETASSSQNGSIPGPGQQIQVLQKESSEDPSILNGTDIQPDVDDLDTGAVGPDQSIEAVDMLSTSEAVSASSPQSQSIRVRKVQRTARVKKSCAVGFSCKKCPPGTPARVFQSEAGLRMHEAAKHQNPKRSLSFRCQWEGCDKAFCVKQALYKHVRRDHKVKFQCDLCPARFSDQIRLNLHRERVHAPGKAPIKCQVCGIALASRQGLSMHMNYSHKELQNG